MKRAALKREAPKPLVPRQLQSPSLLDFHPLEVARQLALIDWELFAAIPHQEFIAKAWDSPALSPVSQKWINHYEQVRGLALVLVFVMSISMSILFNHINVVDWWSMACTGYKLGGDGDSDDAQPEAARHRHPAVH